MKVETVYQTELLGMGVDMTFKTAKECVDYENKVKMVNMLEFIVNNLPAKMKKSLMPGSARNPKFISFQVLDDMNLKLTYSHEIPHFSPEKGVYNERVKAEPVIFTRESLLERDFVKEVARENVNDIDKVASTLWNLECLYGKELLEFDLYYDLSRKLELFKFMKKTMFPDEMQELEVKD